MQRKAEKSTENMSHCDLLQDNLSVGDNHCQLTEERRKVKKLKKKRNKNEDNCEKAVMVDDEQSEKKKRKLTKDVCSSGEMVRKGANPDKSFSPKKKKTSVAANDIIFSLNTGERVELSENYQVSEENFSTGKQNQVENLNIGKLCEMKKKKKRKKAENEYSFTETDCSSSTVKEEPKVENFSPLPKKKKKHKTRSWDKGIFEELKITKGEILQETSSCETSKNLQQSEENVLDKTILDGNSKKQKKEKKLREKVAGGRDCEVSQDDNTLYQKNVVDKLWDKIKLKIERKIQDGKRNQKEEIACQQQEEIVSGKDSSEVEGACYSMAFKFDNNPNVRHYIPKKLMALNGINLQLNEMKEIDLEIPRTFFKGSSLDTLPGYGYNT